MSRETMARFAIAAAHRALAKDPEGLAIVDKIADGVGESDPERKRANRLEIRRMTAARKSAKARKRL